MGNAKALDQFFTRDDVAKKCLDQTLAILSKLNYDLPSLHFLEPAAGGGAFIRAVKSRKFQNFWAYDIEKKQPYVQQVDFLNSDLSADLPDKKQLVVIGNPPFGKRASLAVDFINKSFQYADTVAFIVPLTFDKYLTQKQIIDDANLVLSQKLDPASFTFMGEVFSVRCCLQIWTRRKNLPDLRLRQAPMVHHVNFEMWQYNNTRQAEKYFDKADYKWDFAVPRQGYKDYSIRETEPSKMSRQTQWIFFKAHDKATLKNLMSLDFEKLSHKNTSTPGFGKADVIQEYEIVFGQAGSASSASTQTFQLGAPRPSFAETLPLPGI